MEFPKNIAGSKRFNAQSNVRDCNPSHFTIFLINVGRLSLKKTINLDVKWFHNMHSPGS